MHLRNWHTSFLWRKLLTEKLNTLTCINFHNHMILFQDPQPESVQQTASCIAEEAHLLSFDENYLSPFALSAIDMGIDFIGKFKQQAGFYINLKLKNIFLITCMFPGMKLCSVPVAHGPKNKQWRNIVYKKL